MCMMDGSVDHAGYNLRTQEKNHSLCAQFMHMLGGSIERI